MGERRNKELQQRLKPYFLQRLKIDFLRDKLPRKDEMVIWTHLADLQRQQYSDFLETDMALSIFKGDKACALAAITHLKKLCGHPLLTVEGRGEILNSNRMPVEQVVGQSAKLSLLVRLVEELQRDGHQTLIFSQSTEMLNIIEYALSGMVLERIDGSVNALDRQERVDRFNAGGVDAMLLSTKAAGVGLTLVGADRVVVFDPSWTPAEDSQAVDRCYRIGQKRNVLVYRFITAGTIEEKTYEKQIHKDGIRRTIFAPEAVTIERYFDQEELRSLFSLAPRGVCSVMEKVNNVRTNWDEHDFILRQTDLVVGLSRHDGFYNNQRQEDSSSASKSNPFLGEPDVGRNRKGLGRSQRVLQSVHNEDLQPLGKRNLQIRKALKTVQPQACIDIETGKTSIQGQLDRAKDLIHSGTMRKAAKVLVELLEQQRSRMDERQECECKRLMDLVAAEIDI